MKHAFTVDVEEWYHGIPLKSEREGSFEERLDLGLDRIISILDRYDTRATFFWLGSLAEKHPERVRMLSELGHETGCHGWSHTPVSRMTKAQFTTETTKSLEVLSDITGKPVLSYRAPSFSVDRDTMWVYDILADLEVKFDSSIFPVRHWRYGIPGFDLQPQVIETACGCLKVVPLPVRKISGLIIPVSGGAWFRLYPYMLTRSNLRASERRNSPITFYIHPWELDPGHPRLRFQWRAQFAHYIKLDSCAKKLERLLTDYDFAPLNEVFGC
ncbi:MAG: polysaccharide deacetylase family protein [Candidatus Aegiribacteria sp.]|nr:polysaccharide deacetylase family protein [Candidatus Aegiribacteria sp.]